MSYFATNYHPLTAEYFSQDKPFSYKSDVTRRPIIGLHIFKWDPNISSLKIKTLGGSIVNFTGNSLVEGAVYWISVAELIEAKGTSEDTEVWGVISTFKQ